MRKPKEPSFFYHPFDWIGWCWNTTFNQQRDDQGRRQQGSAHE
jgi:hypothetical protein